MSLADERGMRPLVAHGHFGLGKVYLQTDMCECAQGHLAIATTMYLSVPESLTALFPENLAGHQ